MAEYIDREAAIAVLCDACGNAACPKGLIPRCSYYEKMNSIPAADAIEEMQATVDGLTAQTNMVLEETGGRTVIKFEPKWIPVTERLPECDIGAEVGNIEWISCGMVFAGCFGRGGKYRDVYFRTWSDSTEGIDAKGADYWRAVTLPEPPKEET